MSFLFYLIVIVIMIVLSVLVPWAVYQIIDFFKSRSIQREYKKLKLDPKYKEITTDPGKPNLLQNIKEVKEDEQKTNRKFREFEKLRRLKLKSRPTTDADNSGESKVGGEPQVPTSELPSKDSGKSGEALRTLRKKLKIDEKQN